MLSLQAKYKRKHIMLQAVYNLETKDRRKDGTYPLKVKIYRSRTEYCFIGLKIYLLTEQWDGKKIVNTPEASILNARLNFYRLNIGKVLLEYDMSGETVSMSEIRSRIVSTTGQKEQTAESFISYFEQQILKIGKKSTRETYEMALKKVKAYDSTDKSFSGITTAWLRGFERFCLDDGLSINSTSICLRNVRAIFNRAIDDNIAQLNDYPFRRFKIRTETTRKRSLTVEQIRQLRDHECEPAQRQYRDIFMLIFYLRGINIIDLVNLQQIENGYVHYTRAKTRRLYSVKIEPEALEIIDRYRGKKYLLNIAERYSYYRNYMHKLNKNLKEIGHTEILSGQRGKKKKTGLFPELSTYWARHSWATIASNLDIPKETIAAALGHGGNSVTDIYIDYNMKKVDAANRKVIDYLNEQ